MSRNLFGWSYPPGCSGPPDDEETPQPRCKRCKSFVKLSASDELVSWTNGANCNGKVDTDGWAQCGHAGKEHAPHFVHWDSGCHRIVVCKRCKHRNKFSQ